MNRSLYTGATGMHAQQLFIDNISHNLSNVNTTGFKKTQIHFQDLLYQTINEAGTLTSSLTTRPVELSIGNGVKPVSTFKIFTQGGFEHTGNPLDLAIDGDGFFQLRRGDGEMFYSRVGAFRVNDQGQIVSPDGYYLEPEIFLPADTESINISPDGIIMAKLFNQTMPIEIGQMELARFINPAGLRSVGGNRFSETISSGQPMTGFPNNMDMGTVQQRYLETSNVEIVEEMVNMIVAQRGYEVNSKTVRTAESMLEIAIGLKR
jgi:flagellar basal-body rod protein FlgG